MSPSDSYLDEAFDVQPPSIVSQSEWFAARKELLAREKDLTHRMAALAEQRRQLPWVRIDKTYEFQTESGTRSLAELFGGRSQLIVYHFMFGPGWEEGCRSCSFLADHFDGADMHLSHHDVAFVVVSRAGLAEFASFKRRMGWGFDWVSSQGSDFNLDFSVSFPPDESSVDRSSYNFGTTPAMGEEMPGLSVFAKDAAGGVFHTYSTYTRGLDNLIGTHQLLDLTPKGRNEQGTMSWVRFHDRYDASEDQA